jgi:hypothetical protein
LEGCKDGVFCAALSSRLMLLKRSSAKAVADVLLVDDILPGDFTLGCCAGNELLLPELVLLLGSRKGFLEVGRGGGSSKGE